MTERLYSGCRPRPPFAHKLQSLTFSPTRLYPLNSRLPVFPPTDSSWHLLPHDHFS